MRVGSVRSLHRFPVKSMGGETLDEVRVSSSGFAGDREYALRDEVHREIRGAKNWPALLLCSAEYDEDRKVVIRMPDDRTFRPGDAGLEQALSDLVGTRVTIHALEPP